MLLSDSFHTLPVRDLFRAITQEQLRLNISKNGASFTHEVQERTHQDSNNTITMLSVDQREQDAQRILHQKKEVIFYIHI